MERGILIVAVTAIAAAVWLCRYSVEPLQTANPAAATPYVKLDRWTGETVVCVFSKCPNPEQSLGSN